MAKVGHYLRIGITYLLRDLANESFLFGVELIALPAGVFWAVLNV
jgi:hypothetical protein